MRAAIVEDKGKRWELKEVPDPTVGPNQVLIKIKASGLCYTDVHQTDGSLPCSYPRILGHEPVGEVVAVGEGVTSRKVGDRVGVPWVQHTCGRCEWCERGRSMFCPQQVGCGQMHGGHADLMLTWANATMLLPEALSYEQAAPIFCAGYTVYSGLRIAEPRPHERIAVVGIGGLGHLALQYSHAAGFETIAITHSKDKEQMIRQLGADEVVSDGDALAKLGGADVILATSNSYKQMQDAMKGIRPDGRLVVMGLSTEPMQFTAADLLMKRARVIGSIQNGNEYLYEALDYAAKGKVKVMAETFSMREIHRAYERVAEGSVRFRAVIVNENN